MLDLLQSESARFESHISVPRPWHYGELHNPWSRAATVFDSWGLLDICHSSSLVERVAELIGPDIILFDSQWLPDRWNLYNKEVPLESDAHRFPVEPASGLTVLIGIADADRGPTRVHYYRSVPKDAETSCASAWVDLEPGSILLVDSQLPYRVSAAPDSTITPVAFAIRYFPSWSRYNRDPAAPAHQDLTERYPLFNYATMPLWLIRGRDLAGNDFITGFNVRAGFWASST